MIIAGVDEVGRGPLVGAVVAAAVVLDPNRPILGLTDSKKLSAKKREQLAILICEQSLDYAYGRAEPAEIDAMNILQAALLAMTRAIEGLSLPLDQILIDGNQLPTLSSALTARARAVVGGDLLIQEISAASIIAKVARDQEMLELGQRYPDYGFATHKGYPTAQHLQSLALHGPIPAHRRSFRPVRLALERLSSGT